MNEDVSLLIQAPVIDLSKKRVRMLVLARHRVYLDCGCQVYIGQEVFGLEVVTMADACRPEHLELVDHFNILLRDTAKHPQDWDLTGDEDLVEVVDLVLEKAEEDYEEGFGYEDE